MTSVNPSLNNNGLTPQTNNIAQPLPYPGNIPASGTNPMNQYFSGYPSAATDGYQNANPLGLPYNAGSATMPSTSDTTTLARFQGLAKKIDTQVNATADNKIDTNDLTEALHDTSGKYSSDDKQVIQAMLDNTNGMRGKLDHLDGSDDGTISIDSINKMVVNPNAQPEKVQTPEDKMSNTKAFNVMSDYMGTAIHLDKAGHRADKYVDKHGKLVAGQRGSWSTDRGKLQRMSEDDQVPEDVRTAAKKLLSNRKLFGIADTGDNGGNPDGKISLKDLQKAIDKNPDIDSVTNDTPVTPPVTPAA